MNFQQTLGGFKLALDQQLKQHFDALVAETSSKDQLLTEALLQTQKIALAGGKRIRGALLQTAYFGGGGQEKAKILQVACAIELLHLFFLIHDDIIDRGNLRHGKETLQFFFARKRDKAREAFHFGNSVALIVGDLLFAKANELILLAGFETEQTLEALRYLQDLVATTILGQAQDISIESKQRATEEEVLAMYENKTARYTFAGPLQLGLILAGKTKGEFSEIFQQYASLVGKAYQIQDDLLGIFADKQDIGKSTVSDIEEGKQSLLVVYAKAGIAEADQLKFADILGRKNLTKDEVVCFKNFLLNSGAKQKASDLARQYLRMGKELIEKTSLEENAKFFLRALVEYLEKREI